MVLEPFRDPTDPAFPLARQNYGKVSKLLTTISAGSQMSFDQFLAEVQLSDEQYILALRTSISDVKVFHKRSPESVRVNAYNPDILEAWQANCDLQYVTSPYACGNYIVGYISKGQRGMSDLLRHACEDARKDGGQIQNQVRSIGNKFNHHVEISEQEAVYLVHQMPLRKSSRGFVFINTSPPNERPSLLKSSTDLELLHDDSEDIQCQNMIDRYTRRPEIHRNMCLAEFCAWYEVRRYKGKAKASKVATSDELPESDLEENLNDDPDSQTLFSTDMKLNDGTIMRKRVVSRIIRYVKYFKEKDPENFCREQLLLLSPWFREDKLLEGYDTFQERYSELEDSILSKRKEYEYNIQDTDELDQIEQNLINEQDDEACDNIAPVTQHQELHDAIERDGQINTGCREFANDYDFGIDLGIVACNDSNEELIKNRMEDAEFRCLVQSLNCEQKAIFYHVLKVAKTTDEQQFIFLSGGAGVGKTRVTKAMYQVLVKVFNTASRDSPEKTTVLMTAPTGKAAYLIKGQTLHSAFNIPANQGSSYRIPPLEKLNNLRCQYDHLKWLIIDEISMCGANMFNYINMRLQEITATKKPFGGVNVIAVGDLYQLNPVQDKWIFEQPSQDLSALAPNTWVDNFRMYELTQIMRQIDDIPFSQTLNRLREGKHTTADIKLLKERQIDQQKNYPHEATHLMYRNADVDAHNNTVCHQIQTQKAEVESTDIVIGDVTNEVAKQIKARAPVRARDAMGLSKVFITAVSLCNEMTVNVDVDDGLVNGAVCVTKHIQFSPVTKHAEIIWVFFDDHEVGAKLRRESKHMYRNGIDKTWTPIKQVSREFGVGRYKCAKLRRSQFPLQLACAKTVHRSQGDTLQQVVATKLPDQRRMHMHYVAFSRVTSLDSLYILDDSDDSKITVCSKVKSEMERLRTNACLSLCYRPLYSVSHQYCKITFHNCQSLRLHFNDIKADYNIQEGITPQIVRSIQAYF